MSSTKEAVADNQGENAIQEYKIYPKKQCNAIPDIKEQKVVLEGGINKIVYGRDYEEVCKYCGKKFKDHEAIIYKTKL